MGRKGKEREGKGGAGRKWKGKEGRVHLPMFTSR